MLLQDGWQRCAAFIGEVQFAVNYWLTHHGFSVGIGDTVADPGTMAKIAQLIADAKQSVQVRSLMYMFSFCSDGGRVQLQLQCCAGVFLLTCELL